MNIITYFGSLTELASLLNKADVASAKPILHKLGKEPTAKAWEAHQLLAKACAKFHLDKWACLDLQHLQFNFYRYANLNDVTDETIDKHMRHNEQQKLVQIKLAKERKELAAANEAKRLEMEAQNSGF